METISASWNSSSFETSVAPTSAARTVVRFWLQAITLIPKALPICATTPPTLPRPRTPSVRPGHVIAHRLLPSAVSQRRVLGDEIAGAGQDKRPGQFDRRRRGVTGMNDLHAPLFRSLEIDRGIPGRRRGDHAELGQALDDGTRHRRALPHHADDVEWLQALDDGVGVPEMVAKYGDGRPRIQHRPVRERKSDLLVVVQDGYPEAFLLGRHRVPPEEMS